MIVRGYGARLAGTGAMETEEAAGAGVPAAAAEPEAAGEKVPQTRTRAGASTETAKAAKGGKGGKGGEGRGTGGDGRGTGGKKRMAATKYA